MAADAPPPESGTPSTSWCRPSACSPSRCCPTSTRRSRSPGRVMHTARWDHSVDLAGRAGGRARHRVDRVAAAARSGEGGREGLLGAALADLDPAEARPARTPTARSGCSPTFRSPRSSTAPGCGCAASRNISVIENGSDKTQEFKAHRAATSWRRRCRRRAARQADAGSSVRVQAAGVRDGLPAGVDAAARRGGVQPGAGAARPVRW